MKAKPRYIHDCHACRFLGQVGRYDMYVCDQCDNITLLARQSSNPADYSSHGFMVEVIGRIKREIGGLTDDQVLILAAFRGMPSLLLNMWKRP